MVTFEQVEKAHNAWRKAADRGYGKPPRDARTPDAMERVDSRIRRLKEKWEETARAYRRQQASN